MHKLNHIIKTLDQSFPDPRVELTYTNPLELLMATILSAQCTDQRVNQVTKSLFKKYKNAEDYADADSEVLEQKIRTTGFYKNKTRNIIRCCQDLTRRFSGRVPQTMEELTTLPGVGRKTASVILGNCFGQPAIVVDTHVLRVCHRLGLTNSKDPDRVEHDLAKIFPPRRWVRICHQLILYGRYICKAKRPACVTCDMKPVCPFYKSL